MNDNIDLDKHIETLCDQLIQDGNGFALKQIHDGDRDDLHYVTMSDQQYKDALVKRQNKQKTIQALELAIEIVSDFQAMYNQVDSFFKSQGIDEVWVDDKRLI